MNLSFSLAMFWLLRGTYVSSVLVGFFQLSPALFWLLAGMLLCLVEVVVPTAFTAFIMGLSAFAVALVAKLLPSQVALQVALWIGFSIALIFLSHRLMPKRKIAAIQDATEAKSLTEILPGEMGRVLYEGNSWRARCAESTNAIAPNQKLYVVGREGNTLLVVPENLLDS